MTNIKHKKLIFISVLAFMLVFAHGASANIYPNGQVYYWTWDNSVPPQTQSVPVNNNYTNYPYQNTQAQVTPTNNVTTRPATVLASNTSAPKAKTVTKSTTTTVSQVETPINNQNNGLTALSIAGTNKFMPDTVFEWILVVIMILIIIIIARQFRKKEHHEVHHEVSAVGHH